MLIITLGTITGLTLLGLLANLLLMPWIVRSGREVEVPDLVGLTLAATQLSLERDGLRLGRVNFKVSPDIQSDAVISQNPLAGQMVKAGREITVVMSQGPLRMEIPELRGISMRNARLLINESDLIVGPPAQVHHPEYVFGTVIAQYPLPGVMVNPQSEVQFLTSLGPCEEGMVMPDLIGRGLSEIAPFIRDSRPFRYEVSNVKDPDLPANTIIEQNLSQGRYVGPDSTLLLRVTVTR
ncbi:PASTA domain-containing protein [candidate division KSB1 bacterium]